MTEFKTDLLDLRLCDNMELMKQYPDKHFDLAICDPPYGINVNHNMGRRKGQKSSKHKKAYWDNEPPTSQYFIELQRVSQNQIIWGANHFISIMPKQNASCWVMWDKMFSDEVTFAQFELAWTSFESTCKKFTTSPNQLDRIHPTQKPVALYKWLLHNYAKQGDKILDTHIGSGSIAIACHDYGFHLTGCELDKDYFESMTLRVQSHISQLKMF
jgi:site-specific DNA-methyltransferase (adenine-specific)